MSEYLPGLQGVPATKSNISFLDGQKGLLTYRGYPIVDLAEHSNFEEVALLLLDGRLPTSSELESFDDQLRAKTDEFKQRHGKGESLDSLLPEAFALVREASVRTLGLRHFDVQMIGGLVLHRGMISEMKTGEGKTLMATLAVYLNSLTSKGVHVVTVNDYLARRDAEWMRPVYEALGITVGIVVPGMTPAAKRAAYACDVVYATNNELGFDYLRDNMAFATDQKVAAKVAPIYKEYCAGCHGTSGRDFRGNTVGKVSPIKYAKTGPDRPECDE